MTWDQYSNDSEQKRLTSEFKDLGYQYSSKRGFKKKSEAIGIEEVAQPLVSILGKYADAIHGKGRVFERKATYQLAFGGRKARHVLCVYALARAIDERRIELKRKSAAESIIGLEAAQLELLRNIRFKYWFVSVVGRCLEFVLGKKVDRENVSFKADVAKVHSPSVEPLIAIWSPVVLEILTFVETRTKGKRMTRSSTTKTPQRFLHQTLPHLSMPAATT